MEIMETRDRSTTLGRVSDDEVDVSDFDDSDIASSDVDKAETEVAGVSEQQWSNSLVDQPDIAFVAKANVGGQ